MKRIWRWLTHKCLECGGELVFVREYMWGWETLQEFECTKCGRSM